MATSSREESGLTEAMNKRSVPLSFIRKKDKNTSFFKKSGPN